MNHFGQIYNGNDSQLTSFLQEPDWMDRLYYSAEADLRVDLCRFAGNGTVRDERYKMAILCMSVAYMSGLEVDLPRQSLLFLVGGQSANRPSVWVRRGASCVVCGGRWDRQRLPDLGEGSSVLHRCTCRTTGLFRLSSIQVK